MEILTAHSLDARALTVTVTLLHTGTSAQRDNKRISSTDEAAEAPVMTDPATTAARMLPANPSRPPAEGHHAADTLIKIQRGLTSGGECPQIQVTLKVLR